jgi:hypothetical protein
VADGGIGLAGLQCGSHIAFIFIIFI